MAGVSFYQAFLAVSRILYLAPIVVVAAVVGAVRIGANALAISLLWVEGWLG
jgi:hypothetical protein